VKTKWKMLLIIATVGLLVTSCAVLKRIGITDKRLPDPVFLYKGDPAPYDGWLSHEDLFIPMIQEAYRGK